MNLVYSMAKKFSFSEKAITAHLKEGKTGVATKHAQGK